MNRNLLYAGLGIIGLILVVVIVLLFREDQVDVGREKRAISSHKDPTGGGSLTSGSGRPMTAEHQLELYTKWAQYPPNSRPLFAGMADLTDPFNASRPPVRVLATRCVPKPGTKRKTAWGTRSDCENKPEFAPFRCTLTPESSVSVGKGDFHVYLRCFKMENNRAIAIPVSGVKPKVYRKLFRKITHAPSPIAFGDDGQNGDKTKGDLTYTFKLRHRTRDWGLMYLEVDLSVGGKQHNQRAGWFSTPHTVARFGRGIRDSQTGGHLVVTVPVTVLKPGYYEIAANLQENGGDKRYIASATWEGDLERGTQTIKLRFFGKIMRDKNLDGPYIVRNLRGKRNNSPMTPSRLLSLSKAGKPVPEIRHTEPEWEHFQTGEDHKTGSYRATEFSNKEWQSPAKQERIRFLKKLAADGG